MFGKQLITLLVSLGIGLASAAQAQMLRVPPQGNPALAVELPAGWSSKVDEYGNVDITHPSRHAQMRLSVIADERVAETTLSDMASNMLKKAQFPPYSRTEQASIAGHAGEAFFGEATNANGAHLTYKIVWMKLDASHAAVMARMAVVGATPQETSSLDALVDKVRIVGAK